MKVVGSVVFVLSLFASASPALCQQATDNRPASGVPLQRYLVGTFGLATVGSETSGTLAAEYGETVSTHSQAYLNLSYIDNVMTDTMRAYLETAGQAVTLVTGEPRTFSGRDRGIAFSVGGKYVAGARVRPYIGGGGGFINIRRSINEATIGDISQGLADSGQGDGVVPQGSDTVIKPLAEIVGGVGFLAGKAYVDVAYRYRRAFHSPVTIDLSQITAGIGAKW